MTGRRIVVWLLLATGLAASAFVAGQRTRVEFGNRAVELVVDYDELCQVAAAAGEDVVETLRRFKVAGVTGVAITEQTVDSLLADRAFVPITEDTYSIRSDVAGRVVTHLWAVLPQIRDSGELFHVDLSSDAAIRIPDVPLGCLKPVGVGLPEDAVCNVQSAGLDIVARLVNYPGAGPRTIAFSLGELSSNGIRKIIFAGDQVLGFKGALQDMARLLRERRMCFGLVEFAKQKGELTLAREVPANVIIVHSITANEMPALSMPTVVERFRKAVVERGVRICYVRMFDTTSNDPVAENSAYLARIASSIASAGYAPKAARPLENVRVPRYVRAVVGVGVAAGALLVVLTLVDLTSAGLLLWLVPSLAACVGLAWTGDVGRKAVALVAAVGFPTLGALIAVRRAPEEPTPTARPLVSALARVLQAALITAAGGLLIAGLLSERTFMLRIDQFAGVKVAHVAPILVLAALFAGGVAWRSMSWSDQWARFAQYIGRVAASPLKMWQALGLAAVLGAIAFVLIRSGNEGLEVSGLELKFRALLDELLLVRPRTKEFLIGYPALILGVAFALRGCRQWAASLVVIGSIGLASEINSFCHIHTPLYVTLLRTVNGLVLGAIVGAVLYAILRHLPGAENKAGGPAWPR